MGNLNQKWAGLSNDEVKKRLTEHGFNELVSHEVGWWQVLRRQFTSPFTSILILVTIISFTLGELIDGTMILLFLIINISLSFFQEYRSERSLQLLKHLIHTKTHVFRAGKEELIESKYLVPDDVVLIEAGDIVPADLRLVEVTSCSIDESSLTGESVPVEKSVDSEKSDDLFKAHNIAFSGTHVLTGRAIGTVFATGKNTEIGKIAQLTDESKRVSGFEQSIAAYSQVIIRIIFFTLLIVIGLNVALKQENVDVFSLLLFGVALAVSVIPEGLPVVTTLALSQGAMGLAKKKVVVKRLSAIEDLGSVEILCTDKTGTLTENVLKVDDVFLVDGKREDVLFNAGLASSFLGEEKQEPNNSFDLAIWKTLSKEQRQDALSSQFVTNIPFDPTRRRSTVILEKNKKREVIVRGALEVLIPGSSITKTEEEACISWTNEHGKQGRRVLAVVSKSVSSSFDINGDTDIQQTQFLGVIAFEDPLKASAIPAVAQAKTAGVQVKILTGDSKEVSTQVGERVGLIHSADEVMLGEDLEHMTGPEQSQAVFTHHVFARVTPEQKHTIIHLLESSYSVGFLGEGINDAPALKSASVGIVVKGASDIATQAADVVLLDNDLGVIVEGIKKGRGVFSNTVKYIKVTLASNFGNFFAVAAASLITTELPMLPLQILLLNLLSDFPMISIATDQVDPAELTQPKKYQVHEVVALATLLGVVSSFFDFTFFAVFFRQNIAHLQTYWFIGSVLTELAFIYSIRVNTFFLKSVPPGKILLGLSLFAGVAAMVLPFTGFGQDVFGFVQPSTTSLVLVCTIVAMYFVTSEVVKLAYYSFTKTGKRI